MLSSHSFVTTYRPLHHISAAVNRRTRTGQAIGPDQALTVEEAIRGYTIDAARSFFAEDRLGLGPARGSWPTSPCSRPTRSRPRRRTSPEPALASTVLGGEVAYRADDITSSLLELCLEHRPPRPARATPVVADRGWRGEPGPRDTVIMPSGRRPQRVSGLTVCLSFDIDADSPMLFAGERSVAALSRGEFSTEVAVPRLVALGCPSTGSRQRSSSRGTRPAGALRWCRPSLNTVMRSGITAICMSRLPLLRTRRRMRS